MTQPPNPQQPKTRSGQRTKEILENTLEPLDLIGKRLMGELWRTFYLSVQDAIVLSLLLQIPGLLGRWILRKEFSSFDACLQETPFGVSRYACFVIVSSDFLLWIVLAGRIIGRFWTDVITLSKKKS